MRAIQSADFVEGFECIDDNHIARFHVFDAWSPADIAVARKSLKTVCGFEHGIQMAYQQHFLAAVAFKFADEMIATLKFWRLLAPLGVQAEPIEFGA